MYAKVIEPIISNPSEVLIKTLIKFDISLCLNLHLKLFGKRFLSIQPIFMKNLIGLLIYHLPYNLKMKMENN